jgi:hypothetical protein
MRISALREITLSGTDMRLSVSVFQMFVTVSSATAIFPGLRKIFRCNTATISNAMMQTHEVRQIVSVLLRSCSYRIALNEHARTSLKDMCENYNQTVNLKDKLDYEFMILSNNQCCYMK